MRLTLQMAAGGLLACGLLSAAPPTCITETLARYIALGAAGCTFDGNVFANFRYSASASGGAVAIKPEQITVTPLVLAPGSNEIHLFSALGCGQQPIAGFNHRLHSGTTVRRHRTAELDLTLGTVHIGGIVDSVTVDESTNVGDLGVFERCTEVCQTKTNDFVKFNPVSVVLMTHHVSLKGKLGGASLNEFDALLNLCYLCP